MSRGVHRILLVAVATALAGGCAPPAGSTRGTATGQPGPEWRLAEATLGDGRTFVVGLRDGPEVADGVRWPTGRAHYEAMGFHPPGVRLGVRAGAEIQWLRDSWVSLFDQMGHIDGLEERRLELVGCEAWPRPVARVVDVGGAEGLLVGAVCREADGREIEVTALLATAPELRRVRVGAGRVDWARGACALRAEPSFRVDLAALEVTHAYRGSARWQGGSGETEAREACETWTLTGQMEQTYGATLDWLPLAPPARTPTTVIRVGDVEAFYRAIGPDRVIELAPGDYDLRALAVAYDDDRARAPNPWAPFDTPFGWQPTIAGVEDLVIRGAGARADGPRTHLVMSDELVSVLTLWNVRNVVIEGVRMGHGPTAGTCMGHVLMVTGSAGVTVRDSHLYGSGAVGVWAEDSSDLLVRRTEITGCTEGAAQLYRVAHARFEATTLRDNHGPSCISLEEASLLLSESTVTDNSLHEAVFDVRRGSILSLQATSVAGGQAPVVRTPAE